MAEDWLVVCWEQWLSDMVLHFASYHYKSLDEYPPPLALHSS